MGRPADRSAEAPDGIDWEALARLDAVDWEALALSPDLDEWIEALAPFPARPPRA